MPNERDNDATGISESQTHKETVVVNELLCYAEQYVHSCTKEQIVRSIQNYYDIEEVVSAKELLHVIYKDEIGLFIAS